jgi:hypothetical protein
VLDYADSLAVDDFLPATLRGWAPEPSPFDLRTPCRDCTAAPPKKSRRGFDRHPTGSHFIDPILRFGIATSYTGWGCETVSGRPNFLSPDPLGQASSMSLYDYCRGDGVNGLDGDGRSTLESDNVNVLNTSNQTVYGPFALSTGVNQSVAGPVSDAAASINSPANIPQPSPQSLIASNGNNGMVVSSNSSQVSAESSADPFGLSDNSFQQGDSSQDFGNILTGQEGTQLQIPSITVPGILKVDTDGGWTTNTYNDPYYSVDGHTSGQCNAYGDIVVAPDGPTNINADTDIYATAPLYMVGFVKVGDQVTYTNTITGATWTAPLVDYAPNDTGFGETSVAGANALGGGVEAGYSHGQPVGPVTSGPIEIPVTVTYFPGTATHTPPFPQTPFGLSIGSH